MTTTVDTATSVEVRISDLTVVYKTPEGELPAVSAIDLTLPAGTITGLVGESGSGKSTLALSLLNAVQPPGRIRDGQVEIDGVGDVVGLKGEKLRRTRGGQVGYVFQAAQNSLNPLKPVGKQVLDLGRSHGVDDLRGLIADARDLLGRMGLDGARVLDSYQHELSGGMRQRVGIMLALVLNAHVVVLDEPTTALDMITQANILEIVREIHAERGLTTLVITHDMGVVAEVADAVAVMYGGKIVEHGPVRDVLSAPQHPYTRALTQAIPRLTGDITEARALPGRPPTLTTVPRTGCVFVERCPIRMDVCSDVAPEMITHLGHRVACHAVESGHSSLEPTSSPVEPTSSPVEPTPPLVEPTPPLVEPVETTPASDPDGDLDKLDQRTEGELDQRTEGELDQRTEGELDQRTGDDDE